MFVGLKNRTIIAAASCDSPAESFVHGLSMQPPPPESLAALRAIVKRLDLRLVDPPSDEKVAVDQDDEASRPNKRLKSNCRPSLRPQLPAELQWLFVSAPDNCGCC